MFRSVLKSGLQIGKAGGAAGREDDDFAVDDGGVGGQLGDFGGERLHAVRPVEAGAGEELDTITVFASLNAIAVEFEFVNPARAAGGFRCLGGELRRDEGGEMFFRRVAEGRAEGDFSRRRALAGGGLCRCRVGGLVAAMPGFAGRGVLRVPDVGFGAGDFVHAASGDGRVRRFVGDGRVGFGALVLVVLLDEEPVVLLVTGPGLHADERPFSVQLGAVEDELERAVAQAGVDVGVAGLRLP